MIASHTQLLSLVSLVSFSLGTPNGSETQLSHLNTTASAGGRP
jgi:hypothetical protein